MPQLFQVLKCFKCSVFQVHQTKKSNKWQCKLCGEKQSIKRHYGLGTGKECRLHVQKLNGIRGKIDETNEYIELNTSEDELESNTSNAETTISKNVNCKSKWSNFIDETDAAEKSEENESMYLENAEVVLEVPVKKRKKYKPPKAIAESTVLPSYETNEALFGQNKLPEPDVSTSNHNSFFKSKTYKRHSKILNPVAPTKDTAINSPQFETCMTNSTRNENRTVNTKTHDEINTKTYEPVKVNKNSKWAEFAEEPDDNEYSVSFGKENSPQANLTRQEFSEDIFLDNTNRTSSENVHRNLFTCDDSELDDVLAF